MYDEHESIYGDIPLCDEIFFKSQSTSKKNTSETVDEPQIDSTLLINMTPEMRKKHFLYYKKKLKIEIISDSIVDIFNPDEVKSGSEMNSTVANDEKSSRVNNDMLLVSENEEKKPETVLSINEVSSSEMEPNETNEPIQPTIERLELNINENEERTPETRASINEEIISEINPNQAHSPIDRLELDSNTILEYQNQVETHLSENEEGISEINSNIIKNLTQPDTKDTEENNHNILENDNLIKDLTQPDTKDTEENNHKILENDNLIKDLTQPDTKGTEENNQNILENDNEVKDQTKKDENVELNNNNVVEKKNEEKKPEKRVSINEESISEMNSIMIKDQTQTISKDSEENNHNILENDNRVTETQPRLSFGDKSDEKNGKCSENDSNKDIFPDDTNNFEQLIKFEDKSDIEKSDRDNFNITSQPDIELNHEQISAEPEIEKSENSVENKKIAVSSCNEPRVSTVTSDARPKMEDNDKASSSGNACANDEIKPDLGEKISKSLLNIELSLPTKPEPSKRKSLVFQQRLQLDSQSESIFDVPNENNKTKSKSLVFQQRLQLDSQSESILDVPNENNSKHEIPSDNKVEGDHSPIVTPGSKIRRGSRLQDKLEISSQADSVFDVCGDIEVKNIEQPDPVVSTPIIHLVISETEKVCISKEDTGTLKVKCKEPIISTASLKDASENHLTFNFDDSRSTLRKSISSQDLGYTVPIIRSDENESKTSVIKTPKPLPRNKILSERPKLSVCPPIPPRPFNSPAQSDKSFRQHPIPAPRTKRVGSLNDIRSCIDVPDNLTSDNVSNSDSGSSQKDKKKSGKLKKYKKMFTKLKDKIKGNVKETGEKSSTKFYLS